MWRREEGEGEDRGRGDSREKSRATGYPREKRTLGPPFRGPQAQDLEFRSPSPSPWRWGAERPTGVPPPVAWAEVEVKAPAQAAPWAWLDPVRPAGRAKAGVRGDCRKGGGPGADPTVPRPNTRARSSRLPRPTVCSQSKRSPSHPGGAPRRLPPSIEPDSFIQRVPAAVREHSVLGGQRPEAKGHAWQRLWAAPGPGEGLIPCPTRGVSRPLRPCGLPVGPRSRSPSVSVC